MNGDLYSVTWLVWLFIGWAEAQSMKSDSELDDLGLNAERIHPSVAALEAASELAISPRPARRARWA